MNKKSLITCLVLLVGFFASPLFAGGQAEGEAPVLELPRQPRVYISPENGDGVQDVLELPFSSVVVPGEDMVIVEYNLTVYDGEGDVVYSQSERQDERLGFFAGVFGGEKPRVTIPDSLSWDGTYLNGSGPDGDLVDDGEYTYQLTVIDDAGRFAGSAPFNATVDNTPPEIVDFPATDYTIFSPNGDGVRDTVSLRQSGTQEVSWLFQVVDADDAVVFERSLENATPQNRSADIRLPATFTWDGKKTDGSLEGEGTYRLVIVGTDRAGNETREEHPQGMELNLSAPSIVWRISDGVNVFSPNGDGNRDTLLLSPEVSDPSGMVSWEFTLSGRGVEVSGSRGMGIVPDSFAIDGRRGDGTILPDGEYSAKVTAYLENGNTVESAGQTVVIDTIAPRADVSVQTTPEETLPSEPLVFGGATKRYLDLGLEYDGNIDWSVLLSLDGEVIIDDSLDSFLAAGGIHPETMGEREVLALVWNGTLPAQLGGGNAPDGLYTLSLRGQDGAGNTGESRVVRAIKDSRTPSVSLDVDGVYLTPRGSGENRSVTIRPGYTQADGISEFLMEIVDQRGRMVRSEYKRQPFDSYRWTGLTNGNTVVPDGVYSVELKVVYQNGHIAEASYDGPPGIIVDGTRPRITGFDAAYRRFSPDNDGERDTITIEQSVEGDTDEWTAQILGSSGDEILSRSWIGQIENLTWDGTGADGIVVPDGEYRYVLEGADRAGNITSEDMDIVLDTISLPVSIQPPEVTVSVYPRPFSPDGDGIDETATIRIDHEAESEIDRWTVEILDPRGNLFRRFSGTGVPPATIRWDGTGLRGELVQSAADYLVRASLTDVNDNVGAGETTAPVDILVMRDGDRLRIRIASIQFAPNTPDLFKGTQEQLSQNLATLRRLAEILNRYPDYKIIVEGHAAHIYTESAESMEREQRVELLPLSHRRAEEVMQALIILGVDRDRMEPIGYGGLYPVVPHTDLLNLWKNRRVEFLLEKPE